MKRFILLSILFLGMYPLFGQQEPVYTQYRNNHFLINPAAAGSLGMHALRFGHRAQWLNFPGKPQTTTLSWHANAGRSGLGAYIYNDITGPTRQFGGQLAYAFHIPFANNNTLSIGVAGKILRYRFRSEIVTFQDPNDAAIANASEGITVGDAAFGAYFYNDNLFVGFSAPNLIQSDLNLGADGSNRDIVAQLYRHYFLIGGYKFEFDNVSLEPSVMMRKVIGAPYQFEGNLKLYVLDEQIYFGGSYRSDRTANLIFGAKLDEMLHIMVTQSFTMFDNQRATLGMSSEIMLGLDLPYSY